MSSAAVVDEDAPVLELRGLSAGYDDLAVVRDVDLKVMRGEIVALLGANGTGKSTTILTAAGELPPIGGEVRWRGAVTTAPLHVRARMGMSFVPEERSVLMGMSVRDNLLLGPGRIERALELFPELEPLLATRAGLLSGGEQQMLALARALAANPVALLLDELSLGLAPLVVDRLFAALRRAADDDGVAVLLVEQQARRAMAVADRWYLLRRGAVAAAGDAADGIAAVESLYLGDATATGTE
ncbi:ATP-binding cassette domain-containing protein [Dactylosporangium sp. CS-047395]|uniref:ATP-binding cassette domain-containing protein n=1 Tax=Dactylosporangium sp. CS-047395 TaxID=3239936 RepID=UPI003D92AB85